MIKWLALMAGLAWGNVGMAAEFDFEKLPDRAVGSWAEAVAIGDVNGDRLDDVVLATKAYFDEDNDHRVFVYLQQADGSLAQPVKYKYAEYASSVDLALGDLNNDGIKDIIVGFSGNLLLLIANGDSGFTPKPIATPVASGATDVAVMDINYDGNLDVVCQYWYKGITLFFGDGRGGIGSMTPLASSARGYSDLKIGDVTGDGKPDLVVASGQRGDGFYVHPHNGIAGFWPEITYAIIPATVWLPSAVAVGDFDGDGRNDVAVSISANNPEAAIWLYSGLPSGGLAQPARFSTYDIPGALVSADMDRDGRDDLVVGHRGWHAIGRYMQGAAGLGEELLTQASFNEGSSALAVGDINDDGCSDVAVAEHNAGLVTLLGRNCVRLPATSDFNGDGRSDLFWHFAQTGASVIWRGADSAAKQRVTQITNLAWKVVGTGDLNGDGNSDVVWRDNRTGAGAIWASADYATQLPMKRISNLDWSVVGIGDFNGDGKDDLLWRNKTTGVNGIWKSGNYRDQQAIAGVTDLSWEVVAVDDFNGDGQDDILWRNSATGANTIWKSGSRQQQQPVTTIADRDWRVGGTGDFDVDGQADVLWRNVRNGANALWHAARSEDTGIVVRVANVDWQVAAVGDYDGNGRPDILWRHRSTGQNRIWRSTQLVVERPVTNVADLGWRVVR